MQAVRKPCAICFPAIFGTTTGDILSAITVKCDLLQRSLSDRTKRYAYTLAIKEILVSGELAVVRLVWTLTVTKPDGSGETVTQEPGMDVFRKQPDGAWMIIRYIAYESPR